MGGSYGGYMVMAGRDRISRPVRRRRQPVRHRQLRDASSPETEPWMAAISTTEYGDPEDRRRRCSRRLSPIHKLDRITTPLFVLHGANDTNVPVVEAEQIVASLKARGVPVEYIALPRRGPRLAQDAQPRAIDDRNRRFLRRASEAGRDGGLNGRTGTRRSRPASTADQHFAGITMTWHQTRSL